MVCTYELCAVNITPNYNFSLFISVRNRYVNLMNNVNNATIILFCTFEEIQNKFIKFHRFFVSALIYIILVKNSLISIFLQMKVMLKIIFQVNYFLGNCLEAPHSLRWWRGGLGVNWKMSEKYDSKWVSNQWS